MTKEELSRHVHMLRMVAIDALAAYVAAAQVENAVDNNAGVDKSDPDYNDVNSWVTDEDIVLLYTKQIADEVGTFIAPQRATLASAVDQSPI